ncbi:MarR family winged helix-turn-helix transcriptional regulator [Nocardia huaxiensis]|uniref:Winged helix-turn-helix transcriptional regulator n=1 Tax=Nocardia huaxiensis TaxID=2755382 RepID=A0A7D6ZGP0_9NOCA|nr:MarR family winged helix-turn-helix transcriptional regulator [Nocardia huaxiensis]QLY30439.1 winged helix-turn-helix transcriptional regulator [Nocardia huaxiensis]UFS95962.1 MarR family winged helix-turn-helix transcriptional regulator [Nocardia huaxiensis]
MVRWLTDEEQTTWQAFIRMRQRLDAAIAAGLAQDGMSPSDYEVLVALSAAGGTMRAKELGSEICWDKSRLSKHLSRMAARGLVDRCQAAEDARGREVRLTDEGRRALETAAPNHVDLVRRLFIDEMNDSEAAALRSLSAKVVAEVERTDLPGGI